MYGSLAGTFYNCCHVEFNASRPVVLGNYTQKLSEIWNGDEVKKIRNDFLNNSIPPECYEACYHVEEKGGISNRLQVNKRFSNKAHIQSKTAEDGSVKTYPSYIDIRFGNLCNFKCRTCGPYASSSWYSDSESKHSGISDHYTNNTQLWDSLIDFLPHIEDVYFAGGEPFVQDGHYKLLNLLIESGFSSNISLQYNTNLSYSKFKNFNLKELWSSFKDVALWPSIEGWKNTAEYTRKGLSWNTFESNVANYKEYISTFSSVISILSINSMPELIMWFKKQEKDYYGSILQTPNYYDITVLPKEAKRNVNLKYKNFIIKYEPLLTSYDIEQMMSWLKYMNSADNSHLLSDFKKEQTRLDNLRQESFLENYPEYSDWYKNI